MKRAAAPSVVIVEQDRHFKISRKLETGFQPAQNWRDLEKRAHAVTRATTIRPKLDQGLRTWVCPPVLAQDAQFREVLVSGEAG